MKRQRRLVFGDLGIKLAKPMSMEAMGDRQNAQSPRQSAGIRREVRWLWNSR